MATRSSLMEFQTPRISSEDADERSGRFTIERGRGYFPAELNNGPQPTIGAIPNE